MNQAWRTLWQKPFVLFTFLLLIKDVLARFVLFEETRVWTALFISLPTILFVLALVELLATKRKLLYYMAANLVLTSVYFAAIMYHKYFGIVVTYRALQQANQVTQVNASVLNLMHPYFLLIYLDVVVLGIMLWKMKGVRSLWRNGISFNKKIAASLLVLTLALSVSRVYAHKHIVNEIKQAERMGILNYEIYTIFKDLKPARRVDPSVVTLEGIRQLKGSRGSADSSYWGAAQGKNIVVVQLESFQDFLIGLKVDGKEVTPRLNAFVRESLYFPNVYQQVGQGNTSDAEYVVNTSFYIPENGAASQKVADRELPSLPRLLKPLGYEALTFHTNDVAFWNRKELYGALGFDRYYDKEFFGNEDSVAFGASDEVLYRKSLDVLKEKKAAGQKVYANLISMSAHHPYHLPEGKAALPLPAAFNDTLVGNYLKAQHYADQAFGMLLDEMKAAGLWEDSLLVVYGDHVGLTMNVLNSQDRSLLQGLLGKEYAYDEMLNIPLMIRVPGRSEGVVLPQLGGQVDFMPTMAGLMGVSLEKHIHFGQDLTNHTSNLLGQRYYLPTGSFVNDRVVFVPGESVQDGQTVAVAAASAVGMAAAVETDVTEDFQKALTLLNWSDSYVESLPLR